MLRRSLRASSVACALGLVLGRGVAHADPAPVDDDVRALDGDDGARAVTRLVGREEQGLRALAEGVRGLGPAGRERAFEVASSRSGCAGDAGRVLVALLASGDAPLVARVKSRLPRCGRGFAEPLLAATLEGSPAERAVGAHWLATFASGLGKETIVEALGKADATARPALRAALGRRLREAEGPELDELLRGAAAAPPELRLDLLRALGARVAQAGAAADEAYAALVEGAPDARRWLLVPVAAGLAERDGGARLVRLTTDRWAPVRVRATERLADRPELAPRVNLATLAKDASPRVREAALRSAAAWFAQERPPVVDVAPLFGRLDATREPWTFVRAAAVDALARAPGSAERAVVQGLGDPSSRVREAAARAAGERRIGGLGDALLARLKDTDEHVDVRAAAATALGEACVRASEGDLAKRARALGSPVSTDDERRLGAAALVGLAHLAPERARAEVKGFPPDAPRDAGRAALRAVDDAARSACPAR